MKERNAIKYKFPYWGPFLFQAEVPKIITKKLLKYSPKKQSYRKNLAGHIKDEFAYPKDIFMRYLKPYCYTYLNAASNYYGIKNFKDLDIIDSPWINYMKAGEFNPPHNHPLGLFSMVIYLQIPEALKKENKEYEGSSLGPGSIEFRYGENRFLNITGKHFFPKVGTFFMFPANLDHWVAPFKSKGERISMSANFKVEYVAGSALQKNNL